MLRRRHLSQGLTAKKETDHVEIQGVEHHIQKGQQMQRSCGRDRLSNGAMAANVCKMPSQHCVCHKQGLGIYVCSFQDNARVNQFIAKWLESFASKSDRAELEFWSTR